MRFFFGLFLFGYCCLYILFFLLLQLRILDVFFVVQVYLTQDSTTEYIICILSIVFILLPMASNMIQLHFELNGWLTDVDSKRIVQPYVTTHLKSLYGLCLLFGSSFTAIEICNSNTFQLKMFNMGLNRRQKAVFKNQRIFSTVLLEVESNKMITLHCVL